MSNLVDSLRNNIRAADAKVQCMFMGLKNSQGEVLYSLNSDDKSPGVIKQLVDLRPVDVKSPLHNDTLVVFVDMQPGEEWNIKDSAGKNKILQYPDVISKVRDAFKPVICSVNLNELVNLVVVQDQKGLESTACKYENQVQIATFAQIQSCSKFPGPETVRGFLQLLQATPTSKPTLGWNQILKQCKDTQQDAFALLLPALAAETPFFRNFLEVEI